MPLQKYGQIEEQTLIENENKELNVSNEIKWGDDLRANKYAIKKFEYTFPKQKKKLKIERERKKPKSVNIKPIIDNQSVYECEKCYQQIDRRVLTRKEHIDMISAPKNWSCCIHKVCKQDPIKKRKISKSIPPRYLAISLPKPEKILSTLQRYQYRFTPERITYLTNLMKRSNALTTRDAHRYFLHLSQKRRKVKKIENCNPKRIIEHKKTKKDIDKITNKIFDFFYRHPLTQIKDRHVIVTDEILNTILTGNFKYYFNRSNPAEYSQLLFDFVDQLSAWIELKVNELDLPLDDEQNESISITETDDTSLTISNLVYSDKIEYERRQKEDKHEEEEEEEEAEEEEEETISKTTTFSYPVFSTDEMNEEDEIVDVYDENYIEDEEDYYEYEPENKKPAPVDGKDPEKNDEMVEEEEHEIYPEEQEKYPGENGIDPEEQKTYPEKDEIHPEEQGTYPEKGEIHPEGQETYPQEGEIHPEGQGTSPQEGEIRPEGQETHPEEGETHPTEQETHPEEDETHQEEQETYPEEGETHPEEQETHPEEGESHPEEQETYPEEDEIHPEEQERTVVEDGMVDTEQIEEEEYVHPEDKVTDELIEEEETREDEGEIIDGEEVEEEQTEPDEKIVVDDTTVTDDGGPVRPKDCRDEIEITKPTSVQEHSPDTICCYSLKIWASWLVEVAHNSKVWCEWITDTIGKIKLFASILRGEVKNPDGTVRVLYRQEWTEFKAQLEQDIAAFKQYNAHVDDLSKKIIEKFAGKNVACCPICLESKLIISVENGHQVIYQIVEAVKTADYWRRWLSKLVTHAENIQQLNIEQLPSTSAPVPNAITATTPRIKCSTFEIVSITTNSSSTCSRYIIEEYELNNRK